MEHHLMIDPDLPELIDDHRDLLPMIARENPVEQRRLPGTEIAGDERNQQGK
jgi:hypothetical protein